MEVLKEIMRNVGLLVRIIIYLTFVSLCWVAILTNLYRLFDASGVAVGFVILMAVTIICILGEIGKL